MWKLNSPLLMSSVGTEERCRKFKKCRDENEDTMYPDVWAATNVE